MEHSRTHEKIVIRTVGGNDPHVLVAAPQALAVLDYLGSKEISFTVDEDSIRFSDTLTDIKIYLQNAEHGLVQRALDAAVIKVEIRFVDGSVQAYYDGQDLAEHYRDLRLRGFQGKALLNQLLTDDWGAPPTVVALDGRYGDGELFCENIPYHD